MKRLLFLLCLLLLLSACSAALADPAVSFSPEQPRVGDYVDVTVTPSRADPEEIIYELLLDGEKSITYKPETRPRKQSTILPPPSAPGWKASTPCGCPASTARRIQRRRRS